MTYTCASYMNFLLQIPLNVSPEQSQRLVALQQAFARVCNALAPVVRDTRCWNRVALHHMTYKALREQFPAMGSQMVCNAIYSVCRTSRLVYQHPGSPFNLSRLGNRPLPLIRFLPTSPVYFDRHTLSIKDGRLSMYTLDGRMRFDLALKSSDEASFHGSKLREVVLTLTADTSFELKFWLTQADGPSGDEVGSESSEIPEYLMVEEAV